MSLVNYKANNHPQQTGKRGARDDVDDRGTDPAFMASLEKRFGKFTLDVAAAKHNRKARRYYTREQNGLTQPWYGRVWCNPPYSDCGAWVRKAWEEWPGNGLSSAMRVAMGDAPTLIVMLLPANRVEQAWWQDHVEPYRDRPDSPLHVEFLRGRMPTCQRQSESTSRSRWPDMPSYVIKVDPSRDEYVYWSTIVEAPLAWGDGDFMQQYLTLHDELGDGFRMVRADEFGTSCTDLGDGLRFYDWSTGSLIYKQQGVLNRDDLWALCRRLDQDKPVDDLLSHFDDCDCKECSNGHQ